MSNGIVFACAQPLTTTMPHIKNWKKTEKEGGGNQKKRKKRQKNRKERKTENGKRKSFLESLFVPTTFYVNADAESQRVPRCAKKSVWKKKGS